MDKNFTVLNQDILVDICKKYLTDSEFNIVDLILQGKRNKELSLILDIQESEVVRVKRNTIRKIRAVYKYHYKLNYLDFFRFATNLLTDRQMQYLVRHYRDLKRLHEIADEFHTQTSNVHRSLRTIHYKLDKAIDRDSPMREFLDCFNELPYLNVREIRRSEAEDAAINSIQVGKDTLGQWEQFNPDFDKGRSDAGSRRNSPKANPSSNVRSGFKISVGSGLLENLGISGRREGTPGSRSRLGRSSRDEVVEGTIVP